jgi:hypothetical protein
MKKIILILFLFPIVGFSQYQVQTLCKFDTLVSQVDTIYYMNKETFHVYQKTYYLVRNNKTLNDLVSTINNLSNVYESRIDQQKKENNLLKIQTSSLIGQNEKLINKLKVDVKNISKISTDVNQAVLQIQTDLTDYIKQQKKKSILNSIYIGGSCLLVGILTGLILK